MKRKHLLPALLFGGITITTTQAQTITTIAGTGTAGYNGDNIAATIAQLNTPTGVKVDKNGNVYITDFKNSRLRRIGTNGFITTVAGTGTAGYNGDNMAGTIANLNWPEALDIDTAGNIFIEDTYNHRIRKLGSNGFITTVAGTGTWGYNGDGTLATSANLSYPSDGVLVDVAGNIIISDSYVDRIRKVTASSGIISTIAGIGTSPGNGGYNGDNIQATTARLKNPYALALDTAGNLYFADGDNNRVRRIDKNTGIITTVAGTGTAGYNGDNILATSAQLNIPEGIAFDAAGNLFISDSYNQRIRKVNKSTGIITTIAGTGTFGYNGDNIPATLAQVNYPVAITFDKLGNLYIADFQNSRIRKIDNVGPILPLKLNGFTAKIANGAGLLQWQSANEVNTQKFVVERSQDGSSFSPLSEVAAKNTAGNNSYSFPDRTIKSGSNYYRLKMVDKDGKFTYSETIKLQMKESISLGLAPNPVGNTANLSLFTERAGKYTIQIAGTDGKIISRMMISSVAGANSIVLNLSGYLKGGYIITVVSEEGNRSSIRFIK